MSAHPAVPVEPASRPPHSEDVEAKDPAQERGRYVAPAEEIVERCAKALYAKARELCDRKIVASEEECDLAFVFGIGFAMYLGGPIFYGQQRGWNKA